MKYRYSELAQLEMFRRRSGWSYDRLGQELHVTTVTAWRWCTKSNVRPNRITLSAIREFLKHQTKTKGEKNDE